MKISDTKENGASSPLGHGGGSRNNKNPVVPVPVSPSPPKSKVQSTDLMPEEGINEAAFKEDGVPIDKSDFEFLFSLLHVSDLNAVAMSEALDSLGINDLDDLAFLKEIHLSTASLTPILQEKLLSVAALVRSKGTAAL